MLDQRLILEHRAEANLAAQDVRSQRVGSGLSSVDVGLNYAVPPRCAPYVGVDYERHFGPAARFIIGLRSWF